jgi:ribosome maturation factor RimP
VKRAESPLFFGNRTKRFAIEVYAVLSKEQILKIRQFATEVAEREGCRLYDIEFHDGPGRTLRVFIDKAAEGVGLEDCVNVSRGLNLRLDVEDVIPGGAYELEVSSPGLDRKLTDLWHFQAVVGKTVRLTYRTGEGVRTFEGQLKAVEDTVLKLANAKGEVSLAWTDVERARVVVSFGDNTKKPGKKAR